ncbi:MAG: ribosome biogenesis regulatory protein homolog [Proteobacteria bacterium]|nr:ribosome biogenesis regulatory protein homolog [Pseudomonadota bacterium]
MRFRSLTAASALALLAATFGGPAVQAGDGWDFQLVMPRVYYPERERHYRVYDEDDRDSDEVFIKRRGKMVYDENLDEWVPRKALRKRYVYDDDLEEWVPRKRMRGRMVYDETLDDWVPLYDEQPAVKKPKKPNVAKAAKKAPVAGTTTAKAPTGLSSAVKKPVQQQASGTTSNTVKKSSVTVSSAQAATAPKTNLAAKPAVKTDSQVASLGSKPAVNGEPKTASQTASVAKPSGQKIGCTNGADIITGYGFSSVKPKACTGTTFTYDAKRAQNAYLITLSSATGEITDVKKVN